MGTCQRKVKRLSVKLRFKWAVDLDLVFFHFAILIFFPIEFAQQAIGLRHVYMPCLLAQSWFLFINFLLMKQPVEQQYFFSRLAMLFCGLLQNNVPTAASAICCHGKLLITSSTTGVVLETCLSPPVPLCVLEGSMSQLANWFPDCPLVPHHALLLPWT